MENCSVYLNDCLNYPISTRCTELNRLIDCGSLKDLHDFFPTLVKSIFTAPGKFNNNQLERLHNINSIITFTHDGVYVQLHTN